MESLIKAWRTSRKIYSDFIDKYSLGQLNKIPDGFNNNLIWNIGHIIASQQSLIYISSNLPICIPEDFFSRYKPETKPTGQVSQSEADQIKAFLLSLVEQTEADFANGKFVTFNERMTRTGFYLATLKDAFQFNLYHEGLHLGYMMSIRKFV
jgi:DinB superfamily